MMEGLTTHSLEGTYIMVWDKGVDVYRGGRCVYHGLGQRGWPISWFGTKGLIGEGMNTHSLKRSNFFGSNIVLDVA